MEHNRYYDEEEIELRELVDILLNKWKLILKFTVAGFIISLVMSLALSHYKPPIIYYQATTLIEVIPVEDEELEDGQIKDKELQLVAFVELARSKTVIENSIEKLELKNTPEEVLGLLTVENIEGDHNVEISVLNQDSDKAREISYTIGQEAIKLAGGAMDFASLETKGSATLSSNLITEKEAANYKLNAIIGVVLGFMAGVFFVFIQKYFNDKIQTIEDVERQLGVNVLASIPLCKK